MDPMTSLNHDIPSIPHARQYRGDWVIARQTRSGLAFYRAGSGWVADGRQADLRGSAEEAVANYTNAEAWKEENR